MELMGLKVGGIVEVLPSRYGGDHYRGVAVVVSVMDRYNAWIRIDGRELIFHRDRLAPALDV